MAFSDDECKNATERIEHFFEVHHPRRKRPVYPPSRRTRVDVLGYARYLSIYTARVLEGMPHEQAIQFVEREMRRATGLVPPTGPHPDPLQGPVRLLNNGLHGAADATGP